MATESPRPGPSRALRADAERNRRLIIETARRAFAERGLGVRLDEIAEEAGLGTGTVYRRFKDKDELVRAVFDEAMGEVVALADRMLADDVDGTGLRRFFEAAGELMARDRGLEQILTGSASGSLDLSTLGRAKMEPRIAALVKNAQAFGRLRSGLSHDDLPIIQIMLSATIEATAPVRADLWRRYHALILDALEPPADHPALPGRPPAGEEVTAIIESWRPQPRRRTRRH
jgi:AcrR family transcriptional regulator